jgi:hypothetical protein
MFNRVRKCPGQRAAKLNDQRQDRPQEFPRFSAPDPARDETGEENRDSGDYQQDRLVERQHGSSAALRRVAR